MAAHTIGDTVGMVKFLADAATDEITRKVHVIGPGLKMIAEALVALWSLLAARLRTLPASVMRTRPCRSDEGSSTGSRWQGIELLGQNCDESDESIFFRQV